MQKSLSDLLVNGEPAFTGQPANRPTGLPAYRPTGLPAYRLTDLPTYRLTGLPAACHYDRSIRCAEPLACASRR